MSDNSTGTDPCGNWRLAYPHFETTDETIARLKIELSDALDQRDNATGANARLQAELSALTEKMRRMGYAESPEVRIRQLEAEVARLREALDTLTLVVGLTPIAGNRHALQEAMDLARSELAVGGDPK